MNEILNLWSFVIQENQVLNLNLHPMQKMINQAKLQDMLEDVSVACVNQVGIDLNLIVNHEHMHILLSFLSGFGPRKAKRFIQLIKKNGGRITTRGQIFQDKFLDKVCFNSSVSFMKIRVPPEDMTASITTDILDQTRIHIESYPLAFKVAWDAYCDKGQYENKNVSEYDKLNAVRQVIANPEYLASLDLQFYKRELSLAHQLSMVVLIDLVYHEL
jgi:transcription elongation factor SPT6